MRRPQNGHRYEVDEPLATLTLQPPFTGFVIDRLKLALWRNVEYAAYLDDVFTRIEDATGMYQRRGLGIAYNVIHGCERPSERTQIAIPLYAEAEIDVVKQAFTVPKGLCIKPMCDAILSQID